MHVHVHLCFVISTRISVHVSLCAQVFDEECEEVMDESLYNPFLGQLKVSSHTCTYMYMYTHTCTCRLYFLIEILVKFIPVTDLLLANDPSDYWPTL